MTLLTLIRRSLSGRRVPSALTALAVALGVSVVVAVVLLGRGTREGFIAGASDYGLVVGAKGSPTQLVLNVVFRMDTPTPNIPLTIYQDLRDDPLVEVAVPVILGDAFQGFRYVATSPDYFAARPWRRRPFALAAGRLFGDDPPERPAWEAVLGAEAARRTGLAVGDQFYEGEEMADYPLSVVGILAPTASADDRTIFLSLASFWQMNEVSRALRVKPLTAVLLRARRLSDLPALQRRLNTAPTTQAVFPSAVLLGVFNLLSLVEDVLAVVIGVVAVVVLLSLFVSMYTAAIERRREIATMRALGARRSTVVALVLLESCALAAAGGAAGIVGGHVAAAAGAGLLAARGGPVVHPWTVSGLEPPILAAVVLLGALAGVLPAMVAYRTEVADNLAPLS